MKQITEDQSTRDAKLDMAICAVLTEIDRVRLQDREGKIDLRSVAAEAEIIWTEATEFLAARVRRAIGIRGDEIGRDIASEWTLKVFENGVPGYQRNRAFRPFMKLALWRFYLKQYRRDQTSSRHMPALSRVATGLSAAAIEESVDPFVRVEISTAIELALFAMNPRDRAVLELYSSAMPTMAIASLLKISVSRWAIMSFRARARFIEQLRKTCRELGLPTSTFSILTFKPKPGINQRGRNAA